MGRLITNLRDSEYCSIVTCTRCGRLLGGITVSYVRATGDTSRTPHAVPCVCEVMA